ncbi:glucose-1-phosphate adenylyltransferase subunit GlgD [Oscillibacter sp. MSJ-2]|uniref:Glucose-1-phosphate adenylyltransferase subunit GlgD n=1 Tax=Dysosmobacter acutus TaxID=2841504 RepID=A0ABS6FCR6_9FIRM|nr:glucose-1-phosphate adenylyltransferase subunit GlgD [Dysosmobacter acutus]MBU5628083.1 glucose-1-phosphate adenylyltransferase subunit GlgD [Dysosmobacter acutus]
MNGMHGIIFSYEKRNNLRELSEIRSPSSIPFGGRYRAVDFSLSNLINAGVTDVGVVLHGRYQSLLDHLGTGKNWDLSRKRGGLKILPPFAFTQQWGDRAFRGKMEALAGVRSYLDEIRQDYVVMMDGDLVVNLPLDQVLEHHMSSGADITVVCGNDCFEVDDGTYFQIDDSGRVIDTVYHTNCPRGNRSLEVYVISTRLLTDLVDYCASHDQYSLRRDVLQAQGETLNIRAFIWGGFAAQIRSVKEYYDRSMQLLDPAIRKDLFCEERPIRAKSSDEASAYIDPRPSCRNSLVADGCCVEGTVENSILFPGVTVERGAEVRNCVLFKGAVVRRDAVLHYVIADKKVEILEGRHLMGHETYPVVVSKGAIV